MSKRAAPNAGINWLQHPVTDGVSHIECSSWSGFSDFILNHLAQFDGFIFRGQATTSWALKPTLDRKLERLNKDKYQTVRKNHLERFKTASRGLRGSNPAPIYSANDWWALGQHHGLATPLLDWTESPFVAAFFAFSSEPPKDKQQYAVVYGLSFARVEEESDRFRGLEANGFLRGFEDMSIDIVKPDRDDNKRLISQQGLFTIAPKNVCLMQWIRVRFGEEEQDPVLYKITIPSAERSNALRTLNWMNINFVSLFSDVEGASKHCNFGLELDRY